ncbi:MAG TPA: alkaline phosphatase family protein [Pyrinomonadaceae bacterium]
MKHTRHVAACALALLLGCNAFAQLRGRTTTRAAGAPVGQTQRSAAASVPVRPRLVLLIVVDQFRYDYLARFGDLFAANGLRRLLRDGASWPNANYDHMPTYTAPGHATSLTGTWPAENGIVGNEWYDRDAGKRVTSVTDATAKSLGGAPQEAGASPRRLMASTLGDELRLVTNDRAKVIGISLKDRAAILPAGRHASAAYWFSAQSGRMISSNYYFNQLPAWVAAFNDTRPADKYLGARWDRLLPNTEEYERRAGPDAPPWEVLGNAKDTNTFPHIVPTSASRPDRAPYEALDYTPFGNDLLVSFAEETVAHEQLGQDADTDLLSVSFSANDYVGHRFGPYSQEAMDITLRVDRQIAALLDYVDAHVGLQHTLVAFTADHGVAPIPEQATALGLSGGRIASVDVLTAVRNAIKAHYARPNEPKDATADYVLDTFLNGNVYFNLAALKRDGVDRAELERVACEAALTVPGITRCFTRTQLERGGVDAAADPVARRALHGFYARRSGEIVVVQEPFKYFTEGTSFSAATHGTPYLYDTHVPVIIMGRGVAAGSYQQAATPADIAPTLASVLRVQPPSNSTGRVLIEALGSK